MQPISFRNCVLITLRGVAGRPRAPVATRRVNMARGIRTTRGYLSPARAQEKSTSEPLSVTSCSDAAENTRSQRSCNSPLFDTIKLYQAGLLYLWPNVIVYLIIAVRLQSVCLFKCILTRLVSNLHIYNLVVEKLFRVYLKHRFKLDSFYSEAVINTIN